MIWLSKVSASSFSVRSGARNRGHIYKPAMDVLHFPFMAGIVMEKGRNMTCSCRLSYSQRY